jgi:hypothetical protein
MSIFWILSRSNRAKILTQLINAQNGSNIALYKLYMSDEQ